MCRVCSEMVKTIDRLFAGCVEILDLWGRNVIWIWWSVQIHNHVTIRSLVSWVDTRDVHYLDKN